VYHQQRSTEICDPTTPIEALRTFWTTSLPFGSSDVDEVPVAGPVERPIVCSPLTIAYLAPSREALWERAHEIAAGIARKPPAATQGTVRAIWESLDRPYRAAMDQGLIYTRFADPVTAGKARENEGEQQPPRLR